MAMDLEKIKQLVKLVNEAELAELKLVEGESSVCITRINPAIPGQLYNTTIQPTPILSPPASNTATASPSTEETLAGHIIRSPMVGTAYLASKPDAKPFVEIGQAIKKGDVLCIIEAMKMMNHITADKAGIVKERLIENTAPVEYDQPLFVIE